MSVNFYFKKILCERVILMKTNRVIFLFIIYSFSFGLLANELTIFNYQSGGIKWNSPQKLSWTVITSSFAAHPIGHSAVRVKCESSGQEYYGGMKMKSLGEALKLLFIKKQGLNLMFHSFEGSLETKKEILKYNKVGRRTGKMNFITFLLNADNCERLIEYAKAYEIEHSRNNLYYGLPNDPLKIEGAGCSAFSVSFMKVAGLLSDDYINQWAQTKFVSNKMIGDQQNKNKVPFYRLLFGTKKFNVRKWDSSIEENKREIFFWDPDLMFLWTKNAFTNFEAPQLVKTVREKKARGLILDYRHIEVSTGPFFKNF